MGIQDRDYMKRRPDEEDEGGRLSITGASVEQFFARFLRRNPRFFTYVGIALAVAAVVAIAMVVINERR